MKASDLGDKVRELCAARGITEGPRLDRFYAIAAEEFSRTSGDRAVLKIEEMLKIEFNEFVAPENPTPMVPTPPIINANTVKVPK